ncbi:MAG: hypothetical protein F6J94_27310 [Moorea sp. SIO1F2]|nr:MULTISPECIES: hypothetical protein [unclassified Moorena]NEN97776.1 hypothetical protein [Moorena sp. SIO3I7]NET85475.1 hypothetical protein [Moorena sp. SIO1F2]
MFFTFFWKPLSFSLEGVLRNFPCPLQEWSFKPYPSMAFGPRYANGD